MQEANAQGPVLEAAAVERVLEHGRVRQARHDDVERLAEPGRVRVVDDLLVREPTRPSASSVGLKGWHERERRLTVSELPPEVEGIV